MYNTIKSAVIGIAVSVMATLPAHADWQPPGPVKLMIAFAAGGGADTQARLVAEELEASKGWKFIPENVTGKGGINLLSAMKGMPNDGTVIGMVVTESLAYNRVAADGAGLELSDFTPITTTAGFQMGVVALANSEFTTFDKVLEKAKGGDPIRFGVMSPRLADIAYLLGKQNGVDFNLVSLKGGKAVMNALNAGDIDIGWGAGIQTKAVLAGDMVNIVSGIGKPLDASPDAPLLGDYGVDYNAGGHFMFVAPGGLPDDARAALADAISDVANNAEGKTGGLLVKAFGGPSVIMGDDLDNLLQADSDGASSLMKATE